MHVVVIDAAVTTAPDEDVPVKHINVFVGITSSSGDSCSSGLRSSGGLCCRFYGKSGKRIFAILIAIL